MPDGKARNCDAELFDRMTHLRIICTCSLSYTARKKLLVYSSRMQKVHLSAWVRKKRERADSYREPLPSGRSMLAVRENELSSSRTKNHSVSHCGSKIIHKCQDKAGCHWLLRAAASARLVCSLLHLLREMYTLQAVLCLALSLGLFPILLPVARVSCGRGRHIIWP